MKISNKQKNTDSEIFGIIGDPVSHSLSPAMHNKAFKKLKISASYLLFHVKPQQLKTFFKEAKSKQIRGFNVTVPHKEKCIPFLRTLSPEARHIGAVNTVLLKNGEWHGHNTDGRGYLKSLETEMRIQLKNKHIVLLGAGGAARAVLYVVAQKKPRHISVINRTLDKAVELTEEFSKKFPHTHFEALPFEPEAFALAFPDAHLLINTTSLGLKGTRLQLPLSKLPPYTIVSDLVYRPLKTALLKKAEKLKLKTHTGIGMLLYQGALAFELWTHRKAPIPEMKKALLDAL